MSPTPRRIVDPGGGDVVAVLTWLAANPMPGGPSAELSGWQRQIKRLGKRATPALLHALEFGPTDIQYSAQQGLRALNVEAWAHGYGADLIYTVRLPGRPERSIRPVLTDPSPYPSDAESAGVAGEEAPPYGADPYARIVGAGQAIEKARSRMGALASVRAEAVRELLDAGVKRAEIARRLGVHPNYISQLAKHVKRKK